jgi:hypothetical protein
VTTDITDAQIEALREEALRYCDDFMVQICARALAGSRGHRECCALTWREERSAAAGRAAANTNGEADDVKGNR